MKTPLPAFLSLAAALLACLAILLGPLAAQIRLLPPYTAFRLFALGTFVGALGGVGFGLWTLVKTWNSSPAPGRSLAWIGTLVGVAIFLALAIAGARAAQVPPIHDITTSPDDPPGFTKALEHPDNQGRDLSYPHGDPKAPERQREAYEDLRPISLSVPPAEAFARARRAAEDLGWTVTWESPERGLLEATETSKLFRFVDDVVVRVRAGEGGGSVVDLRSTSRVGVSDLGANAARIRRFAEAIQGEG